VGKNIGLVVPNRRLPGKDAFNIRPRKLAAWINALPRANLGETAKQIYTVLQETNQLAYPYQDRLRFLESLREPLDYVTHSMKKHFIGMSLPLAEKSQKIAAITKDLQSCMATGYKIALEDTLQNNLMIFSKSTLALLTHRCIRYTGQNLLTAYQSYSPFPEQYWEELHKLYRFAEKRKLLHYKIADYQLSYVKKTAVSTEYARILLLSLASPYHLRQGESGKVYAALERWLSQPIIRPLTQNDATTGKFIDNLDQARAPSALALAVANDSTDINSLRIIETHHIAIKLEYELNHNTDAGTSTIIDIDAARPDLSHDLLRRLLIAWGVASKRFFPRTNKNEQVQITVGLSAAHQFVMQKAQPQFNNNMQFTNKYSNRAHFESTEIKIKLDEANATSDDVWGLIYPSELKGLTPLVEQELSIQNYGSLAGSETAGAPSEYEADNWLIVNESIKGLMVNNKDEFKNKAQVGELVSVRRKTNGTANKWSIGVIRWLKFNQDKSMQMGIETLNPNAAAVGIRAEGNPNAPLQRALLLPELKNLKQPACLITSPAPWRVGHKITINMLGKDMPARLTKSLQNTGLFAQFQFEISAKDSQVNEPTETAKDDDYNQVWSSI